MLFPTVWSFDIVLTTVPMLDSAVYNCITGQSMNKCPISWQCCVQVPHGELSNNFLTLWGQVCPIICGYTRRVPYSYCIKANLHKSEWRCTLYSVTSNTERPITAVQIGSSPGQADVVRLCGWILGKQSNENEFLYFPDYNPFMCKAVFKSQVKYANILNWIFHIFFLARPAILSSLYGYDDCIGGVNNFSTEDEYLEDLKRWHQFLTLPTLSVQEELYSCDGPRGQGDHQCGPGN